MSSSADHIQIIRAPITRSGLSTARKSFLTIGAFIADGLIDIRILNEIDRDIRHLILARLRASGVSSQRGSLNNLAERLFAISRDELICLYRALSRLLSVHKLLTVPALEKLTRELTGAQRIMCNGIKGVRIDPSRDDASLVSWHQDFSYIRDSQDAIVYWIPIHDVRVGAGALRLIPGSHLLGPLRVKRLEQQGEHSSLEIVDRALIEDKVSVEVPVRKGQVLVMNTLCVHKSSSNGSSRIRWTAQIRHGNFDHPEAIDRAWDNRPIV